MSARRDGRPAGPEGSLVLPGFGELGRFSPGPEPAPAELAPDPEPVTRPVQPPVHRADREVEGAVEPEVEVRRSGRRRRTVSAYRDGGRIVVLIPASFSRAEERRWVAAMVERLRAQESRRKAPSRDLVRRAEELSRQYLGGRARPVSIRWVDNQQGRWGSCTPLDGTIRISSRLRGMPGWVVDYVLLHELAHLLEPSHNARFWSLLAPYPKLERARGYLEGVAAAADLDIQDAEPPASGGEGHDPARFDPAGPDADGYDAAEVAARFSGDNPPEPPILR